MDDTIRNICLKKKGLVMNDVDIDTNVCVV